ncbi:Acyl-CoA N-acyltransferase [Penicillium occitanis (nom. inval.)]|nr:Acyl-CoA N-acyltransferase [Penicillium occitanis (nom. inval.)]PCH10188.1 hypothetical protein PENOC_003050 [Penicillium occitanis (nom. inval.)]
MSTSFPASNLTIPTPRLLLRRALSSDTEAIHQIRTHPNTTHWTKSTTSDSVSITEEWIRRMFAPNKFSFLITLLESREVIGFISLNLPAHSPLPTIGYEISPSHWNKGYLTEALTAFLSIYWKIHPEGFEGSKRDENGRACVVARVEEKNLASLRVLEKVGFVAIGEERVKDWYGGPDVLLKKLGIWKPE